MNGKRFLLDTNAIISLLQGKTNILEPLQNAEWIGVSVVSYIEFLAFSGLNEKDIETFKQFIKLVDVIELSPKQIELIDLIINIRQKYHLKLPDAVMSATAIHYEAILITSDHQLHSIKELRFVDFK